MADKRHENESKVEGFKRGSDHLRGTIKEVLAGDASHFDEADVNLLKFHGSYQQDDRDRRRALRDAGQDKAYIFMVRVSIPGGVLTADQYLALDALADARGGGSLRITTRQGCQFHHVVKGDLKNTLADVNRALLTTLAACGDVQRNVMTCPAPLADAPHRLLREQAQTIAAALRPRTRAYHEIWLDEEKMATSAEEEPFYGDAYLPRKFKTAIALDGDNCVDAHSNDCGLVAVVDNNRILGFNVLAGGGMGMTHGKADTIARLAEPVAFVAPDAAVDAVRTVAAIFRDFGNRADRRHARLKYVIQDRGIEWFIDEFRRRAAFDVQPARPLPPPVFHDHLGRHPQGDGKHFYGVFVENGRIIDREDVRMKSALRRVIGEFRPGVRFTPHQNVLLTDLDESAVDRIEAVLRDHGVRTVGELSAARRYSMACPALPTCGLAMAEGERLMPSIVDAFEAALDSLGLRDVPLTMRMTGCPNGCARPYTADIAFVGRRPDVYHVFVGGGLGGDRVADLFAADVPTDQLVPVLRPLLAEWARRRGVDESLSDFYQKLRGNPSRRATVTGKEEPTRGTIPLEVIS